MAIKRQITIYAVGERMPPDNKQLLLFRENGRRAVCDLKVFINRRDEFTHWCELPEIETAFERAAKNKND